MGVEPSRLLSISSSTAVFEIKPWHGAAARRAVRRQFLCRASSAVGSRPISKGRPLTPIERWHILRRFLTHDIRGWIPPNPSSALYPSNLRAIQSGRRNQDAISINTKVVTKSTTCWSAILARTRENIRRMHFILSSTNRLHRRGPRLSILSQTGIARASIHPRMGSGFPVSRLRLLSGSHWRACCVPVKLHKGV